MRFPRYFQVFQSNGALRFATYLLPGDTRDIEALYAAALPPPIPRPPALVCVTDAANRRNREQISPGEIATLLGTGLCPVAGVLTAPRPGRRYPTTISGVRAFVDGLPMPLLNADSAQINAIVSYAVQPGRRATGTVDYQAIRSAVTL